MLGRTPSTSQGEKKVPGYAERVDLSFKAEYDNIQQNLKQAYKVNKMRYDRKESRSNFAVRDLVWLYVPSIRQGRTRKFFCLWRGPHIIIDKTL